MSTRQIVSLSGIAQSDTAATANALMERDSDGSSYQTIVRGSTGVRSSGHVYEGVLASQTVSFTVDETVGSKNAAFYPCDATAGAVTVTLPAATGNSGKVVKIKKTDTSANAVIADGNASETIDGALQFALYRQYQAVELICDGTGWHVVNPESRLICAAVAASSALTGSSTETAFDNASLSLAANTSKAGDVYEFEAQGIVTSHNASDTLTVKIKIGSTVIATTGAVNDSVSDIWFIKGTLTIRTVGASGTLIATGVQILAAEGTAPKDFKLASTTVDTTAAQAITCTGQWSTTSGSNSCRLDSFVMRKAA